MWICSFCGNRNAFPQSYAENITEANLPAELIKEYTTIEYLRTESRDVPIYLFIVDTNVREAELKEARDSIQQAIGLLPSESMVGLITFGKMVYVHELGFTECPKCYVLDGEKELKPEQIIEMLGLNVKDPRDIIGNKNFRRFIAPLSESEFVFNSILDDLTIDPWPVMQGNRPPRATGTALGAGIILLSCIDNYASKIFQFCGGPATIGPGTVVATPKNISIRSHIDIKNGNDNTSYMNSATKYYESLTNKACGNNIVVNIIAVSLDQIGLLEMKSLVECTGGYIVNCDSAANDIFKKSMLKMFDISEHSFKKGTFGNIQVYTSRHVKVCGMIGHCTSTQNKKPNVSELIVGQGGTCAWKLGGLDQNTTYAIYFELAENAPVQNLMHTPIPIQVITSYLDMQGKYKTRVTTIQLRHSDDIKELTESFDQEAAAVIIARYALHKLETEEPIEVLKWLDKMLIRLCSKFGLYRKDDPINTFKMPKEFSLYPQFMFHFRRSQLVQSFNVSPDESLYNRTLLLKENTMNSLAMIQPALILYAINEDPKPVNLELQYMKPENVLMLDTFFHVLVWNGETIEKWVKAKLHEKPEYAHLKKQIESPLKDAKQIIEERFPVPKFIICTQGDSLGQERLLKNKMIPMGKNAGGKMEVSETTNAFDYATDEVSFTMFMNHLAKYATDLSNNP
jgi:protein transport protein SEC23